MDPSVVKLLEEDEDESMHSGAEGDAFQAALNRDIGGDASFTQPHDSDEKANPQTQQDEGNVQHQDLSEMEMKQHGSDPQQSAPEVNHRLLHQKQPQGENQQRQSEIPNQIARPTGMKVPENTSNPMTSTNIIHAPEGGPQQLRLQTASNQQANNRLNRDKKVPVALLMHVISPLLDKDKAMKLQALYLRLTKHEIRKEDYLLSMKQIAGDEILKLAVKKMQQSGSHQCHKQGEALSLQNNLRTQYSPQATIQDRETSSTPNQEFNRQQSQQQHHPQNMQASFPTFGTRSSYHQFGGTNVSTSALSIKNQPHDFQKKNMPDHQNVDPGQPGGLSQAMSELRPISGNDPKRMPSGPIPLFTSSVPSQQGSTSKEKSLDALSPGIGLSNAANCGPSHSESPATSEDLSVQVGSRLTTSHGGNSRPPTMKPSVGQKKPLESLSSSPPPSKKQKVSGAFADQSIEQLIDVTAVSGLNLREEEEQLFSRSKEDSRASEASRRVVQEEEEALILQRGPLKKIMAGIMSKYGVKSMSYDVERCLSLCVEERMRGLLCNLIKLSKQRMDIEKSRHHTIVTSDVRHQLMVLNRKAREEWEKKQVEAEKLRELNVNDADGGDKDKDEGRVKVVKVNKDEDDKMRTTAANVAARAAVGGDDMYSKWQMLAEQARNKREGANDRASSSQHSKDYGREPTSASGKSVKELQESGKREQLASKTSSGAMRKFGRNQGVLTQSKIARTIAVKDAIAVLEREPQMSKSSLIYRLYDKIHSDTLTE